MDLSLPTTVLSHFVEGAKKEPEKVAAGLPAMLREAYEAAAPNPADRPQLVHRVLELAATFEGSTDEQLKAIAPPVLAKVGDHDVVTVGHSAWLERQCRRGQLCVLPRTDHLAPISRAHWVATILNDFLTDDLDAPMPMDAAHG